MDKDEILKWLERKGSRRNIEGMGSLRHSRRITSTQCRCTRSTIVGLANTNATASRR
jgi:hypothetical protein